MEIDKHSLSIGDYTRTVGKGPASRPQVPKECPMERSPYFDKNGNPSVFGVGSTAAQARGVQPPPAQALPSSQPNLRAQVPPPLLPAQVRPRPPPRPVVCLAGPWTVSRLTDTTRGPSHILLAS